MSQTTMVRFEILGVVRAWRGDRELDVGPAQRRLLLAVLLAHAGRPVAVSALIDTLWGQDVPPSATNLIHRYVGGLRRLFEPELAPRRAGKWLVREAGGYHMAVDADSLDLLRFRELAGRARRAVTAEPETDHGEQFLAALSLWRGRCSDAVAGAPDMAQFERLDSEYLALLKDAADEALRHGHGRDVLPLVRSAAQRDVFDEGLQARLVLLLAGAGHQAEALQVHRTVQERLVAELGADPGPELRAALATVLRSSVATNAVAANDTPAWRPLPVAQLPTDLASFAGRAAELAAMWQELDDHPGGVAMVAIDGLPGSGKTTLAVRWSHQARDRFPDGQLYVNLRGFDADGLRMSAAEALSGFLVALGLPAERIPEHADAQSALYRSMLSGRRMLVVLDNALDDSQVGPLLPSSAGCAVVITSRNLLIETLMRGHARSVSLGSLSPDEARSLLAHRLGTDRVEREPGAVAEIIERCGRLPLALAVVAARAATNPNFSLADISQALADVDSGLDAFEDGGVKAVLSWSYRALSDDAARAFRYLGLARGPDVSVEAVANLLGAGVRDARRPLAELARGRLLTEPVPGRFVLHDLLKLYAEELGLARDSQDERRAAVERLAQWYLYGAWAATEWLWPSFQEFHTKPVELSYAFSGFDSYDAAVRWCELERGNVVAATTTAMAYELYYAAWQLPQAIYSFLNLRRDQTDWIRVSRIAAEASGKDGVREIEAMVVGDLGNAYMAIDEFDQAISCYEKARIVFRETGKPKGEAIALNNIACARRDSGRLDGVTELLLEAFAINESIGERNWQGDVVLSLGQTYCLQGEFDAAEDYGRRAESLFREFGRDRDRAKAIVTVGTARLRQGDHDAAIGLFGQAAELFGKVTDDRKLADVLRDLAEAYDAAGRPADAEAAREQADTIGA